MGWPHAFGQAQSFPEDDWKAEIEAKSKPLSEQLLREADAEDRRAEQFKGCSFHGRWPGGAHLERASLLRAAAVIVAQHESKRKRS